MLRDQSDKKSRCLELMFWFVIEIRCCQRGPGQLISCQSGQGCNLAKFAILRAPSFYLALRHFSELSPE